MAQKTTPLPGHGDPSSTSARAGSQKGWRVTFILVTMNINRPQKGKVLLRSLTLGSFLNSPLSPAARSSQQKIPFPRLVAVASSVWGGLVIRLGSLPLSPFHCLPAETPSGVSCGTWGPAFPGWTQQRRVGCVLRSRWVPGGAGTQGTESWSLRAGCSARERGAGFGGVRSGFRRTDTLCGEGRRNDSLGEL